MPSFRNASTNNPHELPMLYSLTPVDGCARRCPQAIVGFLPQVLLLAVLLAALLTLVEQNTFLLPPLFLRRGLDCSRNMFTIASPRIPDAINLDLDRRVTRRCRRSSVRFLAAGTITGRATDREFPPLISRSDLSFLRNTSHQKLPPRVPDANIHRCTRSRDRERGHAKKCQHHSAGGAAAAIRERGPGLFY